VTTTLNIPDQLLRQAQTEAAQHGLSLQDFVASVLKERLASMENPTHGSQPWKEFFGSMAHLQGERKKIESLIEEEFEQVDPAQWT
jgi:plasmid stability protein